MNKERLILAEQWKWEGLTSEQLEEKARWLGDARRLGGGCLIYFHCAGEFLALSRFDYPLLSPVFFHAVIGLERALRVHYKADEQSFAGKGSEDPLASLFLRSVEDGQITDAVFHDPRPISKELLGRIGDHPASHAETLARLVPMLRNEYFHGNYLLMPDFFHMALQLREIADALKTTGERSLVF